MVRRVDAGRKDPTRLGGDLQVVGCLAQHAERDVVRTHDGRGVLDLVCVVEHLLEQLFPEWVRQGLRVCVRSFPSAQARYASGGVGSLEELTGKAHSLEFVRVVEPAKCDSVHLRTCARPDCGELASQ